MHKTIFASSHNSHFHLYLKGRNTFDGQIVGLCNLMNHTKEWQADANAPPHPRTCIGMNYLKLKIKVTLCV